MTDVALTVNNKKHIQNSKFIIKELDLDLICEGIDYIDNNNISLYFKFKEDCKHITSDINLSHYELLWYLDTSSAKCYVNECDCHDDGFFDYTDSNVDPNLNNDNMKLYYFNIDNKGHGHFDTNDKCHNGILKKLELDCNQDNNCDKECNDNSNCQSNSNNNSDANLS